MLGCAMSAILSLAAPTPLSDAVLYGRAAEVRTLIAGGADVNEKDAEGMTPLMVAAVQGETAIAQLLLAAGAQADDTDPDGATALMRAASANRVQVAALLLDKGANVNAKSSGGMTALSAAAYGGYAAVVRVLLTHRADANLKDNQGRTPLWLLVRRAPGSAFQSPPGQPGRPLSACSTSTGRWTSLAYTHTSAARSSISPAWNEQLRFSHRFFWRLDWTRCVWAADSGLPTLRPTRIPRRSLTGLRQCVEHAEERGYHPPFA